MKLNVILITADDLNYDSIGVYGSKVPQITPHLDQLASEGMRFNHAHVTTAVCQPSRSVLMTGRYPHRNGAVGFEPIFEHIPTLQEQLQKAGYLNAIIGKKSHLAPENKFCWNLTGHADDPNYGHGRNPKRYYDFTKQVIEKAKTDGKPFFLMANSHDPHRPFAGSDQEFMNFGFNSKVSRTIQEGEIEVPGFLPDIPDVRKEVAEYYTSVHRLDETVGAIMLSLEESGEAGNTLVMFLSDNGMAFPFAKTNCYLNGTKTPWIVRWPGKINPGSVDKSHFISGIDFTPTILDILNLPNIEGVDGASFMPLLLGQTQSERDHVFTVFNRTSANNDYPMRCIQNKSHGYIYNAWSNQSTVFKNESQSGLTFKAMQKAADSEPDIAERVKMFKYRVKEELYDFERDPNALQNLIDESHLEHICQELKEKLYKHLLTTQDPIAETFYKEVIVNKPSEKH